MSKNQRDQAGNVPLSDKSKHQNQQGEMPREVNQPLNEKRVLSSSEVVKKSEKRNEADRINQKNLDREPGKISPTKAEREFDDTDHPHTYDKPTASDRNKRNMAGMENKVKNEPAHAERTKNNIKE